jgi:hypothetical protein
MSRSVELWSGKTDDTPVPPRVRIRVFEAKKGRCHKCSRKIGIGETWTCEHLLAIINGGRNAEDNLDLTCCNCLPQKNAADVAIKSKTYAIRSKHLLRKPSRFAGSRNSKWKKKMDGTVVLRERT